MRYNFLIYFEKHMETVLFIIFDALSDKNAKNPICDMIAILNRVNLNLSTLKFQ